MIVSAIFTFIGWLLTQLLVIQPIAFLHALHIPQWLGWGAIALFLVWCLDD
jgi:hypothetical protein